MAPDRQCRVRTSAARIFDDVAEAIQFDEEGITRVITNISELVAALPAAVQKCLWRGSPASTVP